MITSLGIVQPSAMRLHGVLRKVARWAMQWRALLCQPEPVYSVHVHLHVTRCEASEDGPNGALALF